MRIVFMGTPEFSASILEDLASQHDVVAVYTRPDAVRGRGKQLVASPVKESAQKLGIPVYTPRTLRDAQVIEAFKALDADVCCVAAYGAILPKEVLEAPRFGCLNVHASLLPRWRGAAPVERAILAGDEEVGVCIMRMEEGLDTGAYCISRSMEVESKSSTMLMDELSDLGSHALLSALSFLEDGRIVWTEQNEADVVYADKICKGELDLALSDTVLEADRKVRASSAAHPSRCVIAGRSLTVLEAAPVEMCSDDCALTCGQAVFRHKRLLLGCSDGVLEVIEVKPDGKQAMSAAAFAAGTKALHVDGAVWEEK